MTEPARRSQSQGVTEDPAVDDTGAPAAAPPPPIDFRALYDAQLAYVWNTLRRLGVPASELEDLCHDVFVIVFRHLDRYDRRRPLKPWLFGIAFRVASDYRRSARVRREVPGAARELPSSAPSADEEVARRQGRALVAQALEALELDRRAVFVMHDIDGHAMPEIAEALGVPLNTAYSRLRLARADFTAAVRRVQAKGSSR